MMMLFFDSYKGGESGSLQPRRRNDDAEIETREEEQQRWSLIQLNNGTRRVVMVAAERGKRWEREMVA